jgi:hypothetical protein
MVRGWNPNMGQEFLSFPKRLKVSGVLAAYFSEGYEVSHQHLKLRLRMSGTMLVFPYMVALLVSFFPSYIL